MKRFAVVATTVASVALAGAIMATSVFAAGPAPQAQATPATPAAGLHMGGGFGMRGAPAWAGFEDEVATFLGMTQEQIQAERLAGKSLVQIAQAKGKTEQQLVSTILTAKQADLNQAVAAGQITQAQADLMYQNMQAQVPQMVNQTTVGPMWGNGTPGTGQPQNSRGGMMGGRGGMMRGGGRSNGSSS